MIFHDPSSKTPRSKGFKNAFLQEQVVIFSNLSSNPMVVWVVWAVGFFWPWYLTICSHQACMRLGIRDRRIMEVAGQHIIETGLDSDPLTVASFCYAYGKLEYWERNVLVTWVAFGVEPGSVYLGSGFGWQASHKIPVEPPGHVGTSKLGSGEWNERTDVVYDFIGLVFSLWSDGGLPSNLVGMEVHGVRIRGWKRNWMEFLWKIWALLALVCEDWSIHWMQTVSNDSGIAA